MNFQDFKKDVEAAFKNMIADTLFVAMFVQERKFFNVQSQN